MSWAAIPPHPPSHQPLSPRALADRVADAALARVGATRSGRVRVGVDGVGGSGRHVVADAVAARVAELARPAERVCAEDFLRPRSLRLELGSDDPDAFYESWYDAGGLVREVLAPFDDPDTRGWLPTLWDAGADRATREQRRPARPGAVLVVDGPFLLRPDLRPHLDLVVHLHLSAPARRRRVPREEQPRVLAAWRRYEDDVAPFVTADLTVRADDPQHPALVLR